MPSVDVEENQESSYDPGSLPSLLPIYYKYIFPYGPYCKWLSYAVGSGAADSSCFTHREFSFTLQNDIYVRYQSFANQVEMEKEMQRMNPYKIDIGAIYSHCPKDHNKYHSGTFKALHKELVFDIDMTDYDDVRNCCQGADICMKCWTLMKIAIKILHRALKEDFGFQHILWIYSGRRGVHCWVCDEKARKLSAHARSAIVEYLSLIQGGNVEKRAVMKEPVHPYIRHCLQIVNQYWERYALEDQEIFSTKKDIDKVLKLVPDENVQNSLNKSYQSGSMEPKEKWKKLRTECSQTYETDPKKNRRLRYCAPEIMLEYCFPRLDVNVSKGVNHLLKSPFCVHPKTGRVCVPIDVEKVDKFDPFAVPTISDLCTEVEQVQSDKQDKESANEEAPETPKRKVTHLYKKTRLNEYMNVFSAFLDKLRADAPNIKGGYIASAVILMCVMYMFFFR